MRRRGLPAILLLVLAAVSAPIASAPARAATVRSGVQIQLLDPGAPPRAALRLKPDPAPQSRTLTFSSQVTQSGASSASVGPLQIQAAVSFTGSSVGSNGTIRVPYAYNSFTLLDSSTGTAQQLAAVRASFAQFRGLSGQYTLAPTGAVLSNHLVIPPTVDSTVRSLLQQVTDQANQLTVPLPTQPVGVGARWQAVTQLVAGGLRLSQTYEYSLQSHDGTRLSLAVHYTQTGAKQRFSPSGIPAGTTATVTSYHVTGSGTSVIDLSQVAALNGHIAAQGVQVFRIQRGSQSETINQQVQLGVDVAPG